MTTSDWKAPNQAAEVAFWTFVSNRQEAWARRYVDGAQPPWSDDPVIAAAKFTNMYRELDRGTLFCTHCILPDHELKRPSDIAFATMAYRWFNRIETYLETVRPNIIGINEPNWAAMVSSMVKMREKKQKLYTGAYIATYCPDMGGGDPIVDAVLVLEELWKLSFDIVGLAYNSDGGSLERLVSLIRRIKGVGPFLSWQMALDWTYPFQRMGWQQFAPYADPSLWCEPGPGAIAALHLLDVTGGAPSRQRALMGLAAKAEQTLPRFGWRPPLWDDGRPVRLGLANVEHALCEFQKWERMTSKGVVRGRWAPAVGSAWVAPAPVPPGWRIPNA